MEFFIIHCNKHKIMPKNACRGNFDLFRANYEWFDHIEISVYDKLLGCNLPFGNKILDFLRLFLYYLQIHVLK